MIEPSDVTHIDDNGVMYSYLGGNSYAVWMDKEPRPYWREMPCNNIESAGYIRSVADMELIAELEKERDARDLEQQAKGLSNAHKVIIENKMFRSARDYIDFRAAELLEASKALKEKG